MVGCFHLHTGLYFSVVFVTVHGWVGVVCFGVAVDSRWWCFVIDGCGVLGVGICCLPISGC